MLKLIKILFLSATVSLAWLGLSAADSFGYEDISKEDIKAIQEIVSQYSTECGEFHDKSENKHVELRNDQITRHKLLQDQSTLLVLDASFQCEDFGHPWSGSAGSPTYLVIKGKAYEIVRGSVSTFHVNESTTVINIWHHGSNCKSIASDIISGSKPCFSAIYWDEVTETFNWFAGGNIVRQVY